MANDEHVEILRKGALVWNKWREGNPQLRPDLSEANLSDADLSGAHLFGADIWGVVLNEANLSGADLSGANI